MKTGTDRGNLQRIICSCALAVSLAASAGAAIIYVGPTTNDDYTTIQAAVTAAGMGDTIQVAAGTYRERVVLNKSVTITGDRGNAWVAGPGPNAPILDGDLNNDGTPDMGDGFTIPQNTSLSGITIEGFIIQNFGNGSAGNGVGCGVISWENTSSDVMIRDNLFRNLGYNGIYVGTDSEDIQSNWQVRYNIVIGAPYAGIELTDVVNSQVRGNEIIGPAAIFDDRGDAGVGIEIAARARHGNAATTNIMVKGNTITGAFAGGARTAINILSRSYGPGSTESLLSGITVDGNVVSGSATRGIDVVAESRNGKPSRIENLTITHNTLTTNAAGIVIGLENPAHANGTYDVATITIRNNILQGNTMAGIANLNQAIIVDARSNWWGAASGPGTVGPGTGDMVSTKVLYAPWLRSRFWPKPDFAITATSGNICPWAPNGDIIGSITVANTGSVGGNAGRLTYWADWDWDLDILTSNPNGDAGGDIGWMNPGQSHTYILDGLGLKAASTYGTHTLLFFVDSNQDMDESSEGNNYVTSTYHFTNTVSNYKNKPDFAITNIVLNPASPVPGQPYTAKIYIVNKGLASGNAGKLAIWVSRSAWATNSDGATRTGIIGTLTNGQSTLARFDGLIAPAITDGHTHHFRAFIDADLQTPETSENNNQKTVTYHYSH